MSASNEKIVEQTIKESLLMRARAEAKLCEARLNSPGSRFFAGLSVIDAEYKKPERKFWQVSCRSCGGWQKLSFASPGVSVGAYLVCQSAECGARLDPVEGEFRA